jgi:hypothetical protein
VFLVNPCENALRHVLLSPTEPELLLVAIVEVFTDLLGGFNRKELEEGYLGFSA